MLELHKQQVIRFFLHQKSQLNLKILNNINSEYIIIIYSHLKIYISFFIIKSDTLYKTLSYQIQLLYQVKFPLYAKHWSTKSHSFISGRITRTSFSGGLVIVTKRLMCFLFIKNWKLPFNSNYVNIAQWIVM